MIMHHLSLTLRTPIPILYRHSRVTNTKFRRHSHHHTLTNILLKSMKISSLMHPTLGLEIRHNTGHRSTTPRRHLPLIRNLTRYKLILSHSRRMITRMKHMKQHTTAQYIQQIRHLFSISPLNHDHLSINSRAHLDRLLRRRVTSLLQRIEITNQIRNHQLLRSTNRHNHLSRNRINNKLTRMTTKNYLSTMNTHPRMRSIRMLLRSLVLNMTALRNRNMTGLTRLTNQYTPANKIGFFHNKNANSRRILSMLLNRNQTALNSNPTLNVNRSHTHNTSRISTHILRRTHVLSHSRHLARR